MDPDTPLKSRTTTALFAGDAREYELVFSDEFEQEGRNFGDGNDPRWTAIRKNDCEYREFLSFFGMKFQRLFSSQYLSFINCIIRYE